MDNNHALGQGGVIDQAVTVLAAMLNAVMIATQRTVARNSAGNAADVRIGIVFLPHAINCGEVYRRV